MVVWVTEGYRGCPQAPPPILGGLAGHQLPSTHDPSALSELSNMEDSLPSEASCFLFVLIWRRSLGPEVRLYLNVVPEPG